MVKKVLSAVKWVFIKLVSAFCYGFCYWINPTIFTCAFFGSIIWKKETEEIIKRVKDAWQARPRSFYCLTAAATFICKPVAIVTGTIYLACNLGLSMAYTPAPNAACL